MFKRRKTSAHDHAGTLEALEPRKLLAAEGGDLPFTYFYPEGYAHDGINEFVPITNPGSEEVRFELHARYETGERDQVLAEGVIPAGTRGGVTVNRGAQERLVRADTPYALVLRTSGPVGATMSHYDFGTAVGEAFTTVASQEWTFGEGYKDSNWTRDFVVFYNTSDDDADITLTAYTADGQQITMTQRIGGQRRGGWSLDDDSRIPAGVFGMRLVASRPIVAALSHYEIVTGRGFGAIGTADGGALAGVITAIDFDDNNRSGGDDGGGGGDDDGGDDNSGPGGGGDDDGGDDNSGPGGGGSGGGGDDGGGGSGDDDGTPDQGPGDFGGGTNNPFPPNAFITILNTNDEAATVTLTFIPEDDDVIFTNPSRTLTVPARSRGGISVRDLGFPIDDEFGVVYRSDIKVTATAAVYEGRDGLGMQAVDVAATEWQFGEGFMNRLRAGRSVTEDVYLFNPTGQSFNVTIEFFFSDGTSFTVVEDLDPLELDDEDLHVLPELLAAGETLFYGIRVSSPVPIVATFEHWDDDLGGGFATPGTPGGTVLPLSDVLII